MKHSSHTNIAPECELQGGRRAIDTSGDCSAQGVACATRLRCNTFNTAGPVSDPFKADLEVLGGVLVDECLPVYYRPDDAPPLQEQLKYR